MKKILVAVDGSEPSTRGVRMAADIALKFNARLTLANVMNPLWIPPESYGLNIEAIQAAHAKECQRLVSEAENQLGAPGFKVDRVILEGSPADALAEFAKSNEFDLVVVGSRGKGTITRAMLGSVSGRLAHLCPVPLLIIH